MRPLELTLIITTILSLLMVSRQRTLGRINAAVLVTLFILHGVMEHGRWQLFPAYLAALLTFILLIRNKPLKLLPKIVIPIFALIGFVLGALFPILIVPEVTGVYQVGTFSEAIEYDGRPLMVQIWYPAVIDNEDSENQESRAKYVPDLDLIGEGIAQDFGLPSFFLNHLDLVEPNAYQQPEIAPLPSNNEPFPVILFSHGLGGVRTQNTLQVEALASHGYVVVTTDHHPAAVASVFPDGTTISYDSPIRWDTPDEVADYTQMVEVWTADLVALADQLETWQWRPSSPLYAAIDTENIGVFGHSTGGGTAYQFCARDERCTAALGLDPWLEPMEDGITQNGSEKPILAMTTETALGEDNFAELEQFYEANNAPTWWLTIPDTTHYDYTDFPHLSLALDWLGISSPAYTPDETTTLINDYTRSFFDYHLVDGTGARLYAPSATYPNVIIKQKSD